jgi:sec-independent protein translocase protein TatB
MFFDIGAGEILGLAILGVILVGPERLPHVAAEAAKFVKKLRALSQTATAELRENLGPGFENLQPADLHPKTFIKKQLADALDENQKPVTKKINAKIDPDLL